MELASVRIETDGAVRRAVVVGEVDDASITEVERSLLSARSPGAQRIELDLAGVTYLGSAGVRVLLDAVTAPDGVPMAITASSTIVRRVLELSGVGWILADGAAPVSGPTAGTPWARATGTSET